MSVTSDFTDAASAVNIQQTNSSPPPSWDTLVDIEPELGLIKSAVKRTKPAVCPTDLRRGWRQIKARLIHAVGWHARNPEIGDEACYEVARAHLFSLFERRAAPSRRRRGDRNHNKKEN